MRIKVSGNYLIKYFSNRFSITVRRAANVALFFLICEGLIAEYNNIRALWVVRDHMITPESIDKVLTFAKINNYNHLFVQVRGRGDAYYQSNLVPRSHLLKNSKFDPLGYILKKSGDLKNIKVHAWLNVYYLWSSAQKPSQNDHLLLNHPEWLDTNKPDIMDVPHVMEKMKKDKKFNGEGFYLAPAHPEVDAHLQNVVTELLQNYSLDGIHFDYIRYHDRGWGMNPTGLKFFLNYSSGNMPGLPSLQVQNKPTFSEYKKSAITKFLKKSSTRIKAYQPKCIISAAVKPNLESAHAVFGQEWDKWLSYGYIDWAVPMNYTGNNNIFSNNIKMMKEKIAQENLNQIIMGIGIYNQNPGSSAQKVKIINNEKLGGYSMFSYTVFSEKPSYLKSLLKYLK